MALNLVPQPGPGVNLQNTQNPILQNFTNIDANFAVDHQGFNSGPNSGFHNKLTMPQQSSTPAGIANTTLISFFTDNELYLNKNNSGAIPFTKAVKTTSGYTWLPSGILIQWKGLSGSGPGPTAQTFPIAFPNACLSVVVSSLSVSLSPSLAAANYTTVGFTAFSTNSNLLAGNFIAIGY